MPSRPSQGGSNGTWGAELNAWLDVAHNSDGTIGAGQTGATAAIRFVGGTTSGAPVAGTFVAGDFVLDKSGAVWVCVTGGTPGTWTCATKSRQQLAHSAAAILTENMSAYVPTSSTAPTSQTASGYLLGLRAGDVVTGVVLRNGVAAAGTNPATVRFGIADSTGKILALSADRGTGGSNDATTVFVAGAIRGAFAAPYTVLADGGYYACFIVNGTWGTTQPTLNRTSGLIGSGVVTGGVTPHFSWAGQTDLPIVGNTLTMTALGSGHYAAFY